MRLNVFALAAAVGIVWGGAVLLVSAVNLAWPGYGEAFLGMVASIYPGYEPGSGLGSVLIGTLLGLVDGAICGAILAWLYNLFAARG